MATFSKIWRAKIWEKMCPQCELELEMFLPYGAFCDLCQTAYILQELPPEMERRIRGLT